MKWDAKLKIKELLPLKVYPIHLKVYRHTTKFFLYFTYNAGIRILFSWTWKENRKNTNEEFIWNRYTGTNIKECNAYWYDVISLNKNNI